MSDIVVGEWIVNETVKKQQFVVGAYAAWSQADGGRTELVRALGEEPWVDGLEIPYGATFSQDREWLASCLSPQWSSNVITAIPGTMQTLANDPSFGLASPDPTGREAALTWTEALRNQVIALNESLGRRAIAAVELHSAPTTLADRDTFLTSLREVLTWDWDGAQIVIEHCDQAIAGQAPEKGFLSLADEIAVARELGITLNINWGRLVIEQRDANAALAGIQAAAEAAVLGGVVFSGASPEANAYGPAWSDSHTPPFNIDATSLLTDEAIRACAAAAQGARFLGVKVQLPTQWDTEQRVAGLAAVARSAGVLN